MPRKLLERALAAQGTGHQRTGELHRLLVKHPPHPARGGAVRCCMPCRRRGRAARSCFVVRSVPSDMPRVTPSLLLRQLREHLVALQLPLKSCGEDTTPLRRALVAGLFPHAAKRQADGACRAVRACRRKRTGRQAGGWVPCPATTNPQHWLSLAGTYRVIATGQTVALHPGSVLCGKKPECVVFNELVRTTRQYARDVTSIDPAWLPELAPAFFARQHANTTAV